MSEVVKVIELLEVLHKNGTAHPWFLGWEDGADFEADPPTAVCIREFDGTLVPVVETAEENLGEDGADVDLWLVEYARNALPVLLGVARAAHSYVSGPDAAGLEALAAALDELKQLGPAERLPAALQEQLR